MGTKAPSPSIVPGYYFQSLISDAGFFAPVYKACRLSDKLTVAVKQIRLNHDQIKDGIPKEVLREISLLNMFSKSPNIVRLLDVYHDKRKHIFSLIFECLDMDLHGFIKERATKGELVPHEQVKDFMRQLLTGVSLIHSHSAMHRDLRPGNLLIESKSLNLKIADFGSGRQYNIPTGEYSIDGSYLSYKAPEILLREKDRSEKDLDDILLHTEYTVSADMWSVGCVFAELVSGERLFDATYENNQERLPVIDIIQRELGFPTSVVLRMIKQLRNDEPIIEEESDEEEDLVVSIAQIRRMQKKNMEIQDKARKNLARANKLKLKFNALSDDGFDLLSKMLTDVPESRISAQDALTHRYFH